MHQGMSTGLAGHLLHIEKRIMSIEAFEVLRKQAMLEFENLDFGLSERGSVTCLCPGRICQHRCVSEDHQTHLP